jgi:hypothetical protein
VVSTTGNQFFGYTTKRALSVSFCLFLSLSVSKHVRVHACVCVRTFVVTFQTTWFLTTVHRLFICNVIWTSVFLKVVSTTGNQFFGYTTNRCTVVFNHGTWVYRALSISFYLFLSRSVSFCLFLSLSVSSCIFLSLLTHPHTINRQAFVQAYCAHLRVHACACMRTCVVTFETAGFLTTVHLLNRKEGYNLISVAL